MVHRGEEACQQYYMGSDIDEASALTLPAPRATARGGVNVAVALGTAAALALACYSFGSAALQPRADRGTALPRESAVQSHAFLSLAATSTCSAPQNGKNNGGLNLKLAPATSLSECCARCLETPRCVGYTFFHQINQCWLKSSMGPMMPDMMATSGTMIRVAPQLESSPPSMSSSSSPSSSLSSSPPSSSSTSSPSSTLAVPTRSHLKCSKPQLGMNNGGKVLKKVAVKAHGDCCNRCLETEGCKGYTWVHALGKCLLKSAVGKPEQDRYYNTVCGSVV